MVGFMKDLTPNASRLISRWKLDCKSGTARHVVAHIDVAAVLGDDPPDDRQTKAAPPSLGRVVRQEELLAFGGRNARPVVSHDDADQLIRLVALRFDRNAAA